MTAAPPGYEGCGQSDRRTVQRAVLRGAVIVKDTASQMATIQGGNLDIKNLDHPPPPAFPLLSDFI